MNKFPKEIYDLFGKFGRCKIVRKVYNVSLDHFRIEKEVRHGVCVIVRTKKGEFVLIRHLPLDMPGYGFNVWSLPCGNVEKNESFEEAAIRETLEETGFNIQITGLYKIFQWMSRTPNGETRISYCPVFFGKVVSGELSSESPEILEVKIFKKLPKNFAGELQKYYKDLM